jgi:DNA-binding NtrC family response regulator
LTATLRTVDPPRRRRRKDPEDAGPRLREEGHDVVDTTSARQAQRLLSERSFDVFVVDNMMPEKSGLDLIASMWRRCPRANGRRS